MVGAGDVDNTEHGTLDGRTAGSYLPAVGASGNVLTSDGTNWYTASAAGGGAWTKITSVAGSNVSSIDFVSGITNTYNMYAFVISNLMPSGGSGTRINVRISNDGGSSFKSDSLYRSSILGRNSDNQTRELSYEAITYIRIMDNDVEETGTDCGWGCVLYMNDPKNTTYTTTFHGQSSVSHSNASIFHNSLVGGLYDGGSTKNVDGVRFFTTSGVNFASTGRITLYGIAHT